MLATYWSLRKSQVSMLMYTLHGELAVAWSELKTSFMSLVRFSNHLLCARYLQCPHFGSSAVILNELAQNCELFFFFLVEKSTQGMEKIIAVKKNSEEKSSNLPHIYLNGKVEKTDPPSADYPLTPLRGLLHGLPSTDYPK